MTVWSVPSSVSVIDGFDGRFSDSPAAPVMVAVVVMVAAVAGGGRERRGCDGQDERKP